MDFFYFFRWPKISDAIFKVYIDHQHKATCITNTKHLGCGKREDCKYYKIITKCLCLLFRHFIVELIFKLSYSIDFL